MSRGLTPVFCSDATHAPKRPKTGSYRLSGNVSLVFSVFEGRARFYLIFTQQSEHTMNRAHPEHRLAALRAQLVVAAVPPVSAQPGERPLHHPPARQLHEPDAPLRAADHLDPIP